MNTELKYRTFDELLGEVATDFHLYNREGFIEPAQLIKVAQRVSYDLGLRITSNKTKIIEVINGQAKLPDDFHVLNLALLCTSYKTVTQVPAGTHREDIILNSTLCKKCSEPDPTCACEKTYTVCGDRHVKVIERVRFTTREYSDFVPLKLTSSVDVDPQCENLTIRSADHAEIRKGYLYTNIKHGRVMIHYQGALEDEEGNLLVLDHPQINEYYEYALKQRILENLLINGEDVAQKLGLIESRLRPARNNALTIVNTPNFSELHKIWQMNRKVQYAKYFQPFQSYVTAY